MTPVDFWNGVARLSTPLIRSSNMQTIETESHLGDESQRNAETSIGKYYGNNR
jgi:hypothetical protein